MSRSENLVGLASGLAGLAIVGTLAYGYVYFQPPSRDEESLCLKSSTSASAVTEAGLHVLLVDKTDKWTEPQGSRLRSLIIGMRDQLGLNERLSLFVFENKVDEGFLPKFSRCNPGRGSDTNIFTSNPRRWEKKFNDDFGKPLDKIIAELITPSQGDLSPILEILIDITNREELNRGAIPRRIVIVSDMLQNSDAYTFFPKAVPIRIPSPTPPQPPAIPGGTSPFYAPSPPTMPPSRPLITQYRTPPPEEADPQGS